MAKDGKHVIHAGGIFANPLLHREGAAAAATQPGTVGYFDAGKFTASVAGEESAILYVADFDYLRCKTVDDTIAAGDLVVAIQPQSGMFLNIPAAAGTYTKGQAVSVVNGQIAAATTGETPSTVFAYVEEDTALTAVAGDLVRVVFK
ncbi:hypothetical protein [Tatumella citrea]|uniref:DUF2190 domain-containing protein n=1 Tax=Tatumella citrea TaxID=53336 RepID=A0A1Y0L937_TATCI|nr:hypothetical protein [Tatumella citrea]ARU94566.1 hypothetical protein A7K98_12820 [Tatumella citrea]ARU98604.1 hypothetical protein A7K99_12810 [Tatumella citrea]